MHPKGKRCSARTPGAHSPVSLSPATAQGLAPGSVECSLQGRGPHPGPRRGLFRQMSHSSSPGYFKAEEPTAS